MFLSESDLFLYLSKKGTLETNVCKFSTKCVQIHSNSSFKSCKKPVMLIQKWNTCYVFLFTFIGKSTAM